MRSTLLLSLLAGLPGAVAAFDHGFDYTLEYRRNLDGGLDRGGAWLDQAVLFAGSEDRWYASVLATNGNTFSDRYAGDLQTASNVDAGHTLRLYEAWYQWSLGDQQLLAGLFDLNSEFDAVDTAGLFTNSSFGIGPDFSQSGERGPSIFPHAAFALRLQGGDEAGRWRVAAFDAQPGDPDDEARTSVQLHADEGALLVAELDWQAGWRYALGGWSYTRRFDRPQGDGRGRQSGLYALAEGEVSATRMGSLRGFARVGGASASTLPIEHYFGAGLLLDREDAGQQWGLALAWAGLGSAQRRLMAAEGIDPARGELAVEMTWRWQVNDWLAVQPDLQWVRDPAADRGLDDAVVAALRLDLSF